MKIGTGIQAMLRLCLRNLRGFNVGISDGKDLRYTPFRYLHVARYSYQFHEDLYRRSSNVKVMFQKFERL
jgi:hypothetical protein